MILTLMTTPFTEIVREACAKPEKRLQPAIYPRKVTRRMASRLRQAVVESRRFELDEDVAWLAGGIGALRRADAAELPGGGHARGDEYRSWDDPDLLLAALPSCRAPFPRMFVEWPNRARIRGAGEVPDEDCAETCGMLIEQQAGYEARYLMTPISAVPDPARPWGKPVISVSTTSILCDLYDPEGLRRNVADQEEEILGLWGGRISLKAVLLGTLARNAQGDESALDVADLIARHATLRWSPYAGQEARLLLSGEMPDLDGKKVALADGRTMDARSGLEEQVRSELVENAGDFRFMLGIMVLLNARRRVVDWSDGNERAWSRGGEGKRPGVRPWLEERRVSLVVPAPEAVARFAELVDYEGAKRRRHEVRGHWMHQRKGEYAVRPGCGHAWDDPGAGVQQCLRCGGRKWWRRAHARGDAALGFVRKDYVLEVSEDTRSRERPRM